MFKLFVIEKLFSFYFLLLVIFKQWFSFTAWFKDTHTGNRKIKEN